MLVMWKNMMED